MNIQIVDGRRYHLPNALNDFQLRMYVNLINWKWQHITTECGVDRGLAYDAILPDSYATNEQMPHIYPPIVAHLKAHRKKNPFRIHRHFYHMVSSQAANINLFLPILHHPLADRILAAVKPDFASIDRDEMDNGYCIEYWGGNFDSGVGKGPLRDKSAMAGTDADLAIAYRNWEGQRCLWLIEHKLTEREFTTCGGYRSKGRKEHHDCSKDFSSILADKRNCYYHDVNDFAYWEITETHRSFFANEARHIQCPFQGGMNQLWRNQLLGLAIEADAHFPFDRSTFSVVKHPDNSSLDASLEAYQALVADNPQFTVITSADILEAVEQTGDEALAEWSDWYRGLYAIQR